MPSKDTPTHRHFIVGTAGHIDHGKSTLIEALTGTDPDRLPEEKARGITIELGFAHLEIADPGNSDTTFDLGVIDVPGHADFVKNMVAGVGSVDLALFVVAADDGWMPQSEEHLEILEYLGVRQAVVALTKADTVDDPADRIAEIEIALEGTGFEGAQVVPVCAIMGDGIDELRNAICGALRDTPDPIDFGKPRLAVDRAFSPKGIGTVVTGTLTGGSFERGQAVVVEPGSQKCTIRSLQNHKSEVETSPPGTRTAINLSDVAVGTGRDRKGVRRGCVVMLPKLGETARRLHVELFKTERTIPGATRASHTVRHAQRVRLHHGSGSISARVLFFENRDLNPGESAFAELRLDTPAFAFVGDRFVLRDWSNSITLAGGTILDPIPPPRSYRSQRQRDLLEARGGGAILTPELCFRSLLAREQALAESDRNALTQTPFADASVKEAIAHSEAVTQSGWLLDPTWWEELAQGSGARIDRIHTSNPELPGLPLNTLRSFVRKQCTLEKIFDVLLDYLCENGYVRSGTAIRNADHTPKLPENLRTAGETIRNRLAENLVEPPSMADLATTPDEETALKFLLESGEAITLSEKAIISADGLETAIGRVRQFLENNGKATAADLREAIGTTRRILIPLLERLDQQGVTARDGDFRTLRR